MDPLPDARPDFRPPAGYRRLRLTLAWDGGPYAGWQSQPNAPSVQDTLHAAFGRLGSGAFRPVAAGRTDAGVHAEAMPVHVDVPGGFRVPAPKLARALNAWLPPSVSVLEAFDAPAGFHARFSCTERRYVYRLLVSSQRHPLWHGRALHLPGALDAGAMNAAATYLTGTHDFAAFATQEDRQTVRELRVLRVVPEGPVWEVQVTGESFLRHMVRGLVGTLLLCGQGKLEPLAVRDVLAHRQRSQAGANVPAYGLYFTGASYPVPEGA
ncbi:tRNA pseudouridine(38-40) synthase TruA [Deinococcus deserti]|uniref:tRNA pseudouridine synthase A n=1 Tax=Deinococcus deserti (strain DSM 17065 / CIP 109153 / LMG 22923 / VCD115) TaxID=546414 RepID=C1D057_DEIDV|nr:tRNA pseudouridine(38-40) synthase TruA [Deinococcus deserti]ACO47326.1 putative tRNA-pseudouridine synthase I (tRNA pseudouridylate synthase I) (tRNA-uridine isomerase) [Deinococcus deserti VCD115]